MRILILGIGREDGNLGRKAAIVHLQHCLDGMCDLLAAEFRWIGLLLVAGSRSKVREDFAGIDEEYPDVVLAELGAPALRHSAKRELARVVSGAACGAAQ